MKIMGYLHPGICKSVSEIGTTLVESGSFVPYLQAQ
jgi:hypothetical protein